MTQVGLYDVNRFRFQPVATYPGSQFASDDMCSGTLVRLPLRR